MEKIRLLIADIDRQFTQHLCGYLSNYPDIEVLNVEHNGQDALRRVHSAHPDALLFDLVLPGLDGISLLRSVNEIHDAPSTLCCTRFFSDVALESVRCLGASYLLFKPVELSALRTLIVTCTEAHRNMKMLNKLEADPASTLLGSGRIRNYLVSLGVPSKMVGCAYLSEAVRLSLTDVSLTRNLSKGLYLEISRLMSTTPTRIERCIRNAVSAAYQSGGLQGKMLTCPSNKEFINYILRTLPS